MILNSSKLICPSPLMSASLIMASNSSSVNDSFKEAMTLRSSSRSIEPLPSTSKTLVRKFFVTYHGYQPKTYITQQLTWRLLWDRHLRYQSSCFSQDPKIQRNQYYRYRQHQHHLPIIIKASSLNIHGTHNVCLSINKCLPYLEVLPHWGSYQIYEGQCLIRQQ